LNETYKEGYCICAPYNAADTIKHTVVVYHESEPVGCGAIREYSSGIMEIKRMFVSKTMRRKGIASMILNELECWAKELGSTKYILETGKKLPEAIRLYEKKGYVRIPGYGQYDCLSSNICFAKNLINIRTIQPEELAILEDMLYEAIFQPEGSEPLPRDVIKVPEIDVYIRDFGKKKDDYCLVADLEGKILGAVWVRILSGEIKGYGNVDDQTPEFAISLFREYRNKGIGTLLMEKMIACLKEKGYHQVSLSVDKANYAVNMYKKLGFKIIEENKQDYLMVLK
jgi:GNAT superfamily N-acetyltransferase